MVRKVRARRIAIGISSTLMWVTIAHGQTVNAPVSAGAGNSDGALPAQRARAESLDYGADVGIGESDNVTLLETN